MNLLKKTLSLFAGMVILLFQSFGQSESLGEQIGKIKAIIPIPSGFDLVAENAYIRILAYSPTVVRIRISREKDKLPDDFSYAVSDLTARARCLVMQNDKNKLELQTDSLKLEIYKKPFRIDIQNLLGKSLVEDDSLMGLSWIGSQVTSYKKLHADEVFIGLGEKTGNINRRGTYYQNWNSDSPGYGSSTDPLYASIPFFIGAHDGLTYGLFFDNPNRSYFNFGGGADENLYSFGAVNGEMNYYVFGASSVSRILRDYKDLTGQIPMPPAWSLGFQQSRWGYNNPSQLLEIAQTFRDKRLPADVLVCDINYMDHFKDFTWNPSFTDVRQMMDKMKKMGFDMVTIVDPGIKVEPGYAPYDEGIKNDYFVTYPGGTPFVAHVWPGRVHFPDFTKPDVRSWWGNCFKKPYVENGIRGFWNDMNEPAAWGKELPQALEFGEDNNRQSLAFVHNAYGLLMARATYEGTRKLLKGQRPFVLTRAAYAGIQKYAAMWTGDNVSTDENMLLGVRIVNSLGVSGVPFVGTDIGGFIGNPSAELFIRWMNLGSYMPLFRNHTHIDYNYREPWLFGDTHTNQIRGILENRYELMPYLYSSFRQTRQTGIPVDRMLPIPFTFDEKVYEPDYENQFLFGDNMMVCPLSSTQTVEKVYFPGKELWYRYHTDSVYQGGNEQWVEAPIDDMPVFVKSGAIIPMQSVVQNTKEKSDGILHLNVWAGKDSTNFTYYEDDGESYRYDNGEFYERVIQYNPAELTLKLLKRVGNYTSRFDRVEILYHLGGGHIRKGMFPLTDAEMSIDLEKLK